MLEIIFQGFAMGLLILLLFCWWCMPLYYFFCFVMVKNAIVSGEIIWLIALWPIIVTICLPKSITDKWQKEIEITKKSKKQKPTIIYHPSNSATKATVTKNSSYKTVSYTRKPTKEEIKRERNKMTKKVRERILARDNYTCQICGLSRRDEPHLALHVDHILPVSKGGKTIDSNLQCLCWQCNLKKSDKTP